MQCEDLNVAVLAGFKLDGYICTKLRLRHANGEERIVMHYWYNSWPDQ